MFHVILVRATLQMVRFSVATLQFRKCIVICIKMHIYIYRKKTRLDCVTSNFGLYHAAKRMNNFDILPARASFKFIS